MDNPNMILDEHNEKEPETKKDVFQEMNLKFFKRKSKRKESLDTNNGNYSYFQLFRFATTKELCVTLSGLFVASLAGMVLPYYMVLYGELTAMLGDRIDFPERTSTETYLLPYFGGGTILTNASLEENSQALKDDAKAFGLSVALGALFQLISCAISVDLVNYSALKQISRIRKEFLRSVLRQEMAWFDTSAGGNFAIRITDNLEKIKEGIAEKLAIFVYLITSFVICVAFAIYYGWKLTLVILSCTPFIIVSTALAAKIQNTLTQKELASYASAGDVAEEVLGGIRTVTAFGGEQQEIQRYKDRLQISVKSGQKKGFYSGLSSGLMWMLTYWSYSVAFWYGVYLIMQDLDQELKEYTPAVLMIIMFSVLVGAQNLGMSSPHMEAFSMARAAAGSVFSVIDREPTIDSLSQDGLRPSAIDGNIEFSNVHFRYPARSDVNVLNGLNLTIKAGQTVALVGPSGCGKSTCLQLVQRLYDVLEGSVSFEGIPIREINTTWLRSFIGVVGQEPVLFATTIGENIRYGNPHVTMEGIQNAAIIANCHDFIQKLPMGYDTVIGENGSQLSGGQKQRIAIARALVRNPKILLLDEATSALDPNSEKRVQNALDRASEGRTTIVVSHRLSTITNADRIIYIDKGVVVEDGSHKELLELKGFYYNLVSANNANYEKKRDATLPLSKVIRRRLSSTSPSVYSGDSESGEDEEDEEEETKPVKKIDETYPVSMMRIIQLNAKEWPYILAGCLGAITMGASLPIFAIIFGEFFGIMSITDQDELQRDVNWLSVSFILLGLMAGLSTFLQTYMLSIAGARLTLRLREQVFGAALKQEMGWFDQLENSVGALSARLSGDCASVQGATGMRIGSILQSISTITIGAGISFYYSWNLTLVSIILVPIVLAACFFESRYMAMSNLEEKRSMEGGCRMAVEAISQIRTVASLGQEPHVIQRYIAEMEMAETACRTKIRYRGLVFSLGQAMPYFGYSLCLFYGGILVADREVPYKDVIKISEALIFGSWILGQALAYAPNVNAAIISAGRILNLLDRLPNYCNPPPMPYNGSSKTEGNINYSDIDFHYPARPDIPVLRRLNLDIKKGQTVALVGPSGCGKSTCIQLLLRYYDPLQGRINLDGTATTEFPMDKLRAHLGLVSQEPVLFDRTIAENIAYGDNSRAIPFAEIIEAAKLANIHTFIAGLPLGYETRLGRKGTQLSGGQKQRIAIARALIRNPRILLLDEATSALDSQSENIVQAALDRARAGRTCITIAHRLTTIQNADLICVINCGQVIEKGTHNQLMALGQTYAKLYEMQQVDD